MRQYSQTYIMLMYERPNNKKTVTTKITWNVANYFEYIMVWVCHCPIHMDNVFSQ
jgi:hypothetical protein